MTDYERRRALLSDDYARAVEASERQHVALADEYKRKRADLDQEYTEVRNTCYALRKEISALEENVEDISYGLYKPHFTFQTSDEYKSKLEAVREQERRLLRAGGAATCPVR